MANLEELAPDTVADAVARAVVDAVAAGGDVDSIVARALAAAERDLRLAPERRAKPHSRAIPAADRPNPIPAPIAGRSNGGSSRTVLTEDDVRAARAAGQREIRVGARAIVTALARDAANDAGIQLVEG